MAKRVVKKKALPAARQYDVAKDEVLPGPSPMEAILRRLVIEVTEYAAQLERAIAQANASHHLPIAIPYNRAASFTNALAGASLVEASNVNESFKGKG